MTLEGLLEYQALRDFLYSRMRGVKEKTAQPASPQATGQVVAGLDTKTAEELTATMRAVCDELRAVRDRAASALQIDPAILASRGALEAVSIDVNSPALMRWQRELIGLLTLET